MTPALHELQSAVARALLGGDDALACEWIAADGLDPRARLSIYRHHVETSLADALGATFPVVRSLVGPGFFAWAAHRFVRETPPRSPCLVEYGEAFPDFLAAFPACRHLHWLPDVARLEWALEVAAHAQDAAPIDPARLASIPTADLGRARLRIDPAVSYLHSRWPVDAIWTAHQPGGRLDAVRLDAGEVRLEVRLRGEDVVLRRLARGDFALRREVAAGRCLEHATACALAEDADLDLAGALGALLAESLIIDVLLPHQGDAS